MSKKQNVISNEALYPNRKKPPNSNFRRCRLHVRLWLGTFRRQSLAIATHHAPLPLLYCRFAFIACCFLAFSAFHLQIPSQTRIDLSHSIPHQNDLSKTLLEPVIVTSFRFQVKTLGLSNIHRRQFTDVVRCHYCFCFDILLGIPKVVPICLVHVSGWYVLDCAWSTLIC
ncbi:hypothetical protein CDL15_Pgr016792 [Punica granatum]|uniref:Uncharacterized protein n=1 Tax=Punica granatum TaxID=22663 RepID=A0A218WX01_PUNGR|nr:hypothetical protein CDL15_Pgr016792 [Punica granatum]